MAAITSLGILVGATPAQATTTSYSQAFTGSAEASAAATSAWTTFTASLTGSYTSLTISSSLGGSITLTHATLIQTVAADLKTGTAAYITIGSSIVSVGTCGGGMELTIGPANSMCLCPSSGYYTLRPAIGAGNSNWGGANAATCGGASQTLTVIFSTSGPNVTTFAPTSTTSNSTTLTYNLVFDSSVTGLTSSDFTLSGTGYSTCTIGSPSGSGTTYTVILTGCSPGTVILTLISGSVVDGSSNTGPGSNVSAATVTISQPATVTLSIAGGTVYYNTSVNLVATVNAAGKIIFYAAGKRIPSCVNIVISGAATQATCAWKPLVFNQVPLYAIDQPSVSNYTQGRSPTIIANISRRVSPR